MTLKRSIVFQRKTAQLAYFGIGSAHLSWDMEVQTLGGNNFGEWCERVAFFCYWRQGKYNFFIYVT